MNDLTPTYEAESRQVVLDGRPGGPAGEAVLTPVAGVELAFDRIDGHLVQMTVDADTEHPAELLTRLFGSRAVLVVRSVVQGGEPEKLSPHPELCAALSRLALLDAVRVSSPVPPSSPWWTAESAIYAEQAGLPVRALAEARRLKKKVDDRPRRPGLPALDVAAEVERLETDPAGPPSLLDPRLISAGVIRPGLSPDSDLIVRYDAATDRLAVEAMTWPAAGDSLVDEYHVRLVDPEFGRVLSEADFERTGARLQAQLKLDGPLDELGESWIEVFEGPPPLVHSRKAHLSRRALRWADAALRAQRAPAGLAPQSTAEDWATLATLAWARCRRDWASAGVPHLADPLQDSHVTFTGPAYLAEIVGE
jgi:hypothetical protein